jgi:hypothetical protein
MYNILKVTMRCPRCGKTAAMAAEFRFGLLNLDTYQLGDTLRWNDRGRGLRFPKQRPINGDYSGEAYIVCPVCDQDFWLTVTVNSDRIERADIDLSKPGYISNSQ